MLSEADVKLLVYGERIKSKTKHILEKVAQEENVTAQQMVMMFVVWKHPHATIGTLAQEFDLHQANVSTLCKKMESDGLVQRVRSAEDVRVVTVVLTDQGEQIVIRILTTVRKIINDNLSSQELKDVVQSFLNIERFFDTIAKHL